MLKTLHIKNYALIEEITAELSGGLIILTGETGAGKSILIDALGLVIGNRASTDAVRSGADRAVVEAVFGTAGNRKLRSLFEENDIEPTDEVIVRREVSAKGQSRCFLNDSPDHHRSAETGGGAAGGPPRAARTPVPPAHRNARPDAGRLRRTGGDGGGVPGLR